MKFICKKIISFIIVFTIICSSVVPITVFADTIQDEVFTDINEHWGKDVIMRHYEKGMLKGYPDGTFKPDKGMKRCELIALINRYFGLKKGADVNYSDVNNKAWYFNDTAKAKYYNYVDGLNIKPEENATRQDVVGMLSLLLDLEEQSKNSDTINFTDINGVNKESQNNIKSFSQMGYLKGYPDGTFKPDKIINRAEILSITESVLGYIIRNEEDLANIPEGVDKITIINPDLVIENLNTDAHVYISAGVNGNIIFKNCDLGGKVEITGGNKDCSILFDNVNVNKLVVTHTNEEPLVEFKNSDIGDINIKTKSHIIVNDDTVVDKLDVNSDAEISGKGKVKKAFVNSDGVTIEKKPIYIEVTKKDINVKVGKRKINNKNDSNKPIVDDIELIIDNKIEIKAVNINGQAVETKELIAEVNPLDATVTYQWQIETSENNFKNIVGSTSKNYILPKDSLDKRVRVVVIGIGEYKGELISSPTNKVKDIVSFKIENNWIPIANKNELNQVNNDTEQVFGLGTKYEGSYVGGLDKNYILVSNVNLSGENFEPIGYSNKEIKEFVGKLDGNVYTISNLNIERDEQYQGLFSKLGKDSEITNVHIEDANIKTSSYSGVLAGQANGSIIKDCTINHVDYNVFKGKSIKSNDYVTNKRIGLGGFVGISSNTTYENLSLDNFSMMITDDKEANSIVESVGGLVGVLDSGLINNCNINNIVLYATHDKDKNKCITFFYLGGLVGKLNNIKDEKLTINDCEVTNIDMLISGLYGKPESCGGFIGNINTKDNITKTNGDIEITNCNVEGIIRGEDHNNYIGNFGTFSAGGFIGIVDGSGTPSEKIEIRDCNTSVEMFDFVKNSRFNDIAVQNGGVGGFAGRLINVNVNNCNCLKGIGKFSEDNSEIIDRYAIVSGFSSYVHNCDIKDSSVKGDVNTNGFYAGGFASCVNNSNFERCCMIGDVNIKDKSWGSGCFIGVTFGTNEISNCYALGNIENNKVCGGFIGMLTDKNTIVKNSYCSGKVISDKSPSGAFIGMGVENLNLTNCYYNITKNVDLAPIGSIENHKHITGQTEEELKTINTFKGWDISEKGSGQSTVWLIEEGVTYPYLNKCYVHVESTKCNVIRLKCPMVNAINSTNINGTVGNDITTLMIDVEVSKNATWSLYNDVVCSSLISNNQVNLNVGENVYYIKVLAEDGVSSKIYILNIVRKDVVKVESINVSGKNGVNRITECGGTLQMVADILPNNATNKNIDWSVDDENVATISETGLLTAVKDGNVVVTAKSKDGSEIVGNCSINIIGQKQNELKAVRVESCWNAEEHKEYYAIAKDQSDITNPIGIWKVEDLLIINTSKEYLTDGYVLLEDIDFDDINCYRYPNDKHFDTDNDGIEESVYEELKQDGNSGTGFVPIGLKESPFKGEFNGNKHIISHLYINRSAEDNVGLFGYIDKRGYENGHLLGEILSLEIKNSRIMGNSNVGVLVGCIEGSHIDRCSSTGDRGEVIAFNGVVGGLVGSSTSSASIESCYTEQTVNTNSDIAGGVIGVCSNSRISDCYSIGNVNGKDMVGGLAGKLESSSDKESIVSKTYAMGTVGGRHQVGGLVGYNDGGKIERNIAFNDSVIGSNEEVGRIVGKNVKGTLENNYANNIMNISTDNGNTNKIIQHGLSNNTNGLNMLKEEFSNVKTYKHENEHEHDYGLEWNFRFVWEMDENLERPILRKEVIFG